MRRRDNDDRVSGLWAVLTDPVRSLPIAVALLALALTLWWFQRGAEPPAGPPPATRSGPVAAPGRPGEYLFCFWNIENLFDDRDDRRLPIDEPYDNWFANDPAARGLKSSTSAKPWSSSTAAKARTSSPASRSRACARPRCSATPSTDSSPTRRCTTPPF